MAVATVLAALALGVVSSADAAQPGRAVTTARAVSAPVTAGGSAWARGLWVWDQPSAKTLVSFAASRGISDLFVSVPDRFTSSARLDWVRSVSRLAVKEGIRLQALGGDAGWIDDPAAALAWQRDALASGLFTGVHVDLEPWQHPAWDSDNASVVRGYLDVLRRLKAATALPFEADVSFWLWTLQTDDGTPLDRAVMAITDKVTIMSYRDTVTGDDSVTGVGARELATAAALGKPARLAVETNDLGSDPVAAKQTFFGSTETAVNAALTQIDAAEAGNGGYAGLAVHDYRGYQNLR